MKPWASARKSCICIPWCSCYSCCSHLFFTSAFPRCPSLLVRYSIVNTPIHSDSCPPPLSESVSASCSLKLTAILSLCLSDCHSCNPCPPSLHNIPDVQRVSSKVFVCHLLHHLCLHFRGPSYFLPLFGTPLRHAEGCLNTFLKHREH